MSEQPTPPLKAAVVPVTPFVQNCTILWCTQTMEGVVVDPGGDIDQILEVVKKEGITLVKILVTHGHLDHAGGVAELRERLEIPVEGPHQDDLFWLEGMAKQAEQFGVPGVRSFTPERWLKGGDTVTFGKITLAVHHCPGHTPGHVIFHHPPSHFALVGDVLFKGSIGRTDFPQGDHAQLLASIRGELWPLGDDTVFVSGHGPASTFGEERRTNPFVGDGVA